MNCIDYWKVNLLAKRYVDEEDEDKKEEEKDNDPCLMPSRFMLLYGADDDGLSGHGNLDDHPDRFKEKEEEHKISVANLRKGLSILEYNVEETGSFDDKVYHAFLQYHWDKGRVRLAGVYPEDDDADKTMDAVAEKYGMFTWKTIQDEYDGEADHNRIQEDLNTEYGDGLVKEKGADPMKFRPGVAYHYVWVPFSPTTKLMKDIQTQNIKYQIVDCESNKCIWEGDCYV
jgi:hypothetical protein